MPKKLYYYVIVGIVSALLYTAGTIFLSEFCKWNYTMAANLSLIMSGFISYTGHCYYTFKVPGNHKAQVIKFLMQLLVTAFINSTIIGEMVTRGLLPTWLAALIISMGIPVINFIIYNRYTFKR